MRQAGRIGPDPVRDTSSEVLTTGKNGLECAAPFDERPSGQQLKGSHQDPSQGVDGSENRAIMGGSLRRNANGYGGKALRPVSKDL